MTEQDLKFKIESYCKRKRNVKTKKNNIKAKGEAYENAMSYPSDAEVIYYSGESASHCRRLAKEADVVVIVAGNDYLDEGECVANESVDVTVQNEGGDRTDCLGLKEEQLRIIDAVGKVRQDAVVVLVGGSMILMDEWEDQVGAILMAYYPGMEGGKAVADVLFGKTNPGGKLPFVIPKKEEDLPEIDWEIGRAHV